MMMVKRWMGKMGITRKDIAHLLWTVLAALLVLAMIKQTRAVYQGATLGLKTWWEIVFPSLLPFFIISEILMQLGFVRFVGVLLEPVMRPLFNVPGAGGFVMVIGFTSGFPIGSAVTAQLRQQRLCTKIEAERLMSFTNNSSPLFMLTAVAVGMFNRPELGIIIAGAHYLANICLGLLLRFYGGRDPQRHLHQRRAGDSFSPLAAFRAMLQHQRQNNTTLGQLMGEAVTTSIHKLITIGGFIILFSVLIQLLHELGVISVIAAILGVLLIPLGFGPDTLNAIASGFFEMTIGTKLASQATTSTLEALLAVSLILGWSGLSIHAQVAGMIARTDISIKIFIITRIAHAFLAAFLTWLFYEPLGLAANLVLPVMSRTETVVWGGSVWGLVYFSLLAMFILLGALLTLSFFLHILKFLHRCLSNPR